MRQRRNKVSINKLFGRKEFLTTGPFLTDDGVVVGSKDSVTIKLDRDTLTQRVWEVPSDDIWLTGTAGPVVFGACRGRETRALSIQSLAFLLMTAGSA